MQWTRNGNVFTEHADHNSQILFMEWLAAKGKDVVTPEMVPWRREHMSTLVKCLRLCESGLLASHDTVCARAAQRLDWGI